MSNFTNGRASARPATRNVNSITWWSVAATNVRFWPGGCLRSPSTRMPDLGPRAVGRRRGLGFPFFAGSALCATGSTHE